MAGLDRKFWHAGPLIWPLAGLAMAAPIATPGRARAETTLTIRVDLPVNSASYCQPQANNVRTGDPTNSSAQITGDGISTHVPAGSGGLRGNLIIKGPKDYTIARQAIAINAAAYEYGNESPQHQLCIKSFDLVFTNLPSGKDHAPAYVWGIGGAGTFSLGPPENDPNYTCAGASAALSCTLKLPLGHKTTWDPPPEPEMHRLYVFAGALLNLSEALSFPRH